MWPNPVCVWPATDSSEGLSNITKCCNADQYLGWLMLRSYIASAPESALTLCLASLEPSLTGTWVSSVNGFDWHHETVSDPESRVKKSCVASLPVFIRYRLTNTTRASCERDLEESRRQSWFISTLLLEQHARSEPWGTTDAHTLPSPLLLFIFNITHMLDSTVRWKQS